MFKKLITSSFVLLSLSFFYGTSYGAAPGPTNGTKSVAKGKSHGRKAPRSQLKKVDIDMAQVVRLIAYNTLNIEVLAPDYENEGNGFISTGQTLAQLFDEHRKAKDEQGRPTTTVHYDRVQCVSEISNEKIGSVRPEISSTLFSCRIVVVERLKELALTTYNFKVQKIANSSELKFVSPIGNARIKNDLGEKASNKMQALVLFLDSEKDAETFAMFKRL